MSELAIEPWEPEETIGKLWHGLATSLASDGTFDEEAVELTEVAGRLAVFFRGLGGGSAVAIRPVALERAQHRLALKQRLGHEAIAVPRASFDGEVLRLPERLDVLPKRAANAALYIWLTASAAYATAVAEHEDPLRTDLLALAHVLESRSRLLAECPGLIGLHRDLARICLTQRPRHGLPRYEEAIESIIRSVLGDSEPMNALACTLLDAVTKGETAGIAAPRGYRPYAPVVMWCESRDVTFSAASDVATMDADPAKESDKDGTFRAKRRKSDQVERRDSLILHKFEALLSWAEFLNLNRRVDDDDNDDAKKAADDQEEISLGQISKAPATRLKLHLDLAPEDVDRERLAEKCMYPEWDTRTGAYLPDHCCVFESDAPPVPQSLDGEKTSTRQDTASQTRIRKVKRQFEALRPGRIVLSGQRDGDDLDLEAAVRSQVDLLACGENNDQIWRHSRPRARDLAVSILLDISRSTESAIGTRSVIEIECEALTALAWGLSACGDDFAVNAFSSLKRDRVYVTRCKRFGTAMSSDIEARIRALRPGFYTRLGTAIRHVSVDLAKQNRKRRLLLIITDGKPNDLDHYEGHHGIEDTRMAIREARRAGNAVHGITIDSKGQSWLVRMFGAGRFSIVPDPERLTRALPLIYRQLVRD